MDKKVIQRKRRHNRVRAKISGTKDIPRLAVFKSNKFIYAQIINDEKGETLAFADTRKVLGKTLTEKAKLVGEKIAELAKDKKISKVVYDRGGFVYTGAIKELAESARGKGLKF